MARKSRRNPPDLMTATLVPLMPWAVVGVVLYFYGDKIFKAVGAKITGTDPAKYDAAITTIKSASKVEVAKGIAGLLTMGLYDPSKGTYTTADKAIIDMIQTAIEKGWVRQDELPYPTATTSEQLVKNKAFINSPAMLARRRQKK